MDFDTWSRQFTKSEDDHFLPNVRIKETQIKAMETHRAGKPPQLQPCIENVGPIPAMRVLTRPFQSVFSNMRARSARRQAYPHSLSYHAKTFTCVPFTTIVDGASMMAERGSLV